MKPDGTLPNVSSVLAVSAHPDDESFGLGAILAAFSEAGVRLRVLCFTHGEASTLVAGDRPLAEVRTEELDGAAEVLGVEHLELLSYPDGHLTDVPLAELEAHVDQAIDDADLLLVFDEGGITGHPDHCRATDAAVAAAIRRGTRVLAWAIPEEVASVLNTEFGTEFVGRKPAALDLIIEVDRARQRDAIACHFSQSQDNPVLRRRLDLLGEHEHLRWLPRP